ncbi:HPP family protein [Leptothrix sp. BB-4]
MKTPNPIHGPDVIERLRVVAGAFLGILLTAWLSHRVGGPAVAWLVAPLGATAVLVFGVPTSPLAQPWPVLGGNTLSALVGIACVHLVAPVELRVALAVAGAIGLMFALRCLHPPGGASALLVSLTGVTDPSFALQPVALNSLLLVLAGIAWNHATGRPYPHRPPARTAPEPATPEARAEARAEADDIDTLLARGNQVLDIDREDLKALLHDARLLGYQRRLARLSCAEVMSRDPVTVGWRTPLPEAWALLRHHRIKALPVVDLHGAVVGIVTQADFMRAAEARDGPGLEARVSAMRALGGGADTGQPPGQVADIMTRRVRVARIDRSLVDLIPLFRSAGHHHLPIVDADNRLVGIVTESDVVAALARLDPLLAEDVEVSASGP